MKLHITVPTLLAFAASSAAISNQLVKNYCLEDVYLSLYGNGETNTPFLLPSGQAFISNIVGFGNTATVSKNPNIFSPDTAKLILGSSSDKGILYWSVSSAGGDPFVDEKFQVASEGSAPDVCQSAAT